MEVVFAEGERACGAGGAVWTTAGATGSPPCSRGNGKPGLVSQTLADEVGAQVETITRWNAARRDDISARMEGNLSKIISEYDGLTGPRIRNRLRRSGRAAHRESVRGSIFIVAGKES